MKLLKNMTKKINNLFFIKNWKQFFILLLTVVSHMMCLHVLSSVLYNLEKLTNKTDTNRADTLFKFSFSLSLSYFGSGMKEELT